ncbi:MAG: transporter substrate-binding domain-containing protein, partial [Brevibacterium aurantiacum]|nr:transporter substrate-binding domain-containing protein [Brevibacterium aurantiacum]
AILRGYAKQYEGEFKVVGKPFTEEPYGVGLPKGDDAMRDAVNDALQKGMDDGDWKKAFEYTLGSADDVEIPEIDRY